MKNDKIAEHVTYVQKVRN